MKTDRDPDVCFTIMPFGGWEDDYYRSIYRPAIEDAGLEPHRADDLFRPSVIVKDIWAYTKRARVLLAVLTGRNSNVFYELGLAHALGKPVVMVTELMEDVPFDLRNLRIIDFEKNVRDWGVQLRKKVTTALKEVRAAPVEAVLPAFLDVTDAEPKLVVTAQQKQLAELAQNVESLRRELRSSVAGPVRPVPPEAVKMAARMLSQNVMVVEVVNTLMERGLTFAQADEMIRIARQMPLTLHGS